MLCSTVGNPAGMQPISTDRFSARAFAKTSPTLTPPLRFAARRRGARVRSVRRFARSRLLPGHDRLVLVEDAEVRAGGVHVLVAAAAEVHHDRRGAAQF